MCTSGAGLRVVLDITLRWLQAAAARRRRFDDDGDAGEEPKDGDLRALVRAAKSARVIANERVMIIARARGMHVEVSLAMRSVQETLV